MRDPEFDAISAKDIFEEARDRLQIVVTDENKNRMDAKEAMRFNEGDQWDSGPVVTSAIMEEPELVINLTDALVMRVENNIRQQRPRGKCHPVGDGANDDLAEVMNGIGRHVETRSSASIAYDTAAGNAIVGGWGYFRLIAEYVSAKSFQKDLRILPIRNIFTVFMDPGAIMPAGEDAMWCLISKKQKVIEYRRNNPSLDLDGFKDLVADADDWLSKEEIRLAEYFRIREKEEKLFLVRGAGGEEFTRYKSELVNKGESFDKDTVVARLAERGLRLDGERDSVRRAVEWFLLNGTKVIQREQMPGEFIPVFRVEGRVTDIDGEVKRRGMVKAMMDPQRMVNYGEVAKIKRLGLAPKAPWIAAEGQLDGHPEWTDANTQSYSVLTYKPVTVATAQGDQLLPPPQRQPPAQIEAGFSEFVQGMRTNLLAVAGMPHEPGQDMQSQVVSGRAIRQREKMSDQSHFGYYDNLTLAIAQCWRVILDWIPATYVEKNRIQRIIGDDSVAKMVKLNESVTEGEGDAAIQRIKNDVSVGEYDVVMDTGPGYETKREEGAEALMELVATPTMGPKIAQVGADLVVRSLDHPYMQELADRFAAMTPDGLKKVMESLPDRAKSIVQSLANENAQLKQALQAAQSGITKEHMKSVTKVHDTEVRADTSIKVAEIKAGAQLLNTRAEAEHERAAAREMLDNAQRAENSPPATQPMNGA